MNGTRAQHRLYTVTDPLQVLCWTRIVNAVPSYFTRQRSDTSLIPHESVSGPWRRNFSFINIQPQLFEHNVESSNGNGCVIFLFFPGREKRKSAPHESSSTCLLHPHQQLQPAKQGATARRSGYGRSSCTETSTGQARARSW